jgi:hypothetical protein
MDPTETNPTSNPPDSISFVINSPFKVDATNVRTPAGTPPASDNPEATFPADTTVEVTSLVGTAADASAPTSQTARPPAAGASPLRVNRARRISEALESRLFTVPTGQRSLEAACSRVKPSRWQRTTTDR